MCFLLSRTRIEKGCQFLEEIEVLVGKAKSNRLMPLDCAQCGTFIVIMLGGPQGIKQYSAIIDPPQSCILAVGIMEKWVLLGIENLGEFVLGTFMTFTLNCDHRVIVDGAIGVVWLGACKVYIEDPMILLL